MTVTSALFDSRNMNRYSFLLMIIFITGMSAGCSDSARLQPLGPDATILAFGDSLTYGTGTSRNNAYPAVLEKLVRRKVINAGIPGEISRNGLARLPALLEKHHPALIIICHGGNDILRKLDLSQTRDNIQQMISLARNNNIDVVLVGVPEFSLFLSTVALYPELAEKNNVPIADVIVADIISNNSLKSDHIHPNTKGYQALAENIAQLLIHSGAISAD